MRDVPQLSFHDLGKLYKNKVVGGVEIIFAFVVYHPNILGLGGTFIR
jgi:hypothetical protein